MEKFKKVLKFLVNNILFIAILLLIFSVTLNKVITKDLLTDFLIQKVSNETTEVLDKNFNELDKEDINKINNDIKTNKDVNNLIEKYARNTIEVMSENNTYDMNLLDDAKAVIKANKNILRDEYKINVTDKQIDEAVDKLDKEYKLNDYYNNLVKQTSNNLSKEQKDALKLYKFITSTKLMIILSIIINKTSTYTFFNLNLTVIGDKISSSYNTVSLYFISYLPILSPFFILLSSVLFCV